jgi:hypothetical protein
MTLKLETHFNIKCFKYNISDVELVYSNSIDFEKNHVAHLAYCIRKP